MSIYCQQQVRCYMDENGDEQLTEECTVYCVPPDGGEPKDLTISIPRVGTAEQIDRQVIHAWRRLLDRAEQVVGP